jgi:hypothetical protein
MALICPVWKSPRDRSLGRFAEILISLGPAPPIREYVIRWNREGMDLQVPRFPAFHSSSPAAASDLMRIFYFDMKDGIPVRDRRGLEFSTTVGAIEHSKDVARRLRHDPRIQDRALSIVVVDEMGAEIHQEPVHPQTQDAGIL